MWQCSKQQMSSQNTGSEKLWTLPSVEFQRTVTSTCPAELSCVRLIPGAAEVLSNLGQISHLPWAGRKCRCLSAENTRLFSLIQGLSSCEPHLEIGSSGLRSGLPPSSDSPDPSNLTFRVVISTSPFDSSQISFQFCSTGYTWDNASIPPRARVTHGPPASGSSASRQRFPSTERSPSRPSVKEAGNSSWRTVLNIKPGQPSMTGPNSTHEVPSLKKQTGGSPTPAQSPGNLWEMQIKGPHLPHWSEALWIKSKTLRTASSPASSSARGSLGTPALRPWAPGSNISTIRSCPWSTPFRQYKQVLQLGL